MPDAKFKKARVRDGRVWDRPIVFESSHLPKTAAYGSGITTNVEVTENKDPFSYSPWRFWTDQALYLLFVLQDDSPSSNKPKHPMSMLVYS